MQHGSTETTAPKGAVARLAAIVGIAFGAVSAMMILIVLLLTAANVAGRYLFTAPIRGAEEATGFLVVAIVMLGAAEAYRRNDHIRIDLLTERLGPRANWLLDGFAHLAVIVFSFVLLRTGLHTVDFSRRFGAYSAGYLQIPMWIPQTALVAGGGLLLAMGTLRLVDQLLELRRKDTGT
jgi:TRAP-type C4-dicarboxylate transport system permease small subunit